MLRRLFVIGLVCLGLVACATPHTLTSEQVHSLGIAKVQVVIPPQAAIRWATEEEHFQKTQAASPEMVKEHVRQKLQALVQAEYDRQLKPYFQGPHKVRLLVTIRHLIVPSLAERVFINDTATFKADYDVVDVKTGVVLARFEDVAGSAQKMVGGLLAPLTDATGLTGSDPAAAIIQGHAIVAREWLAKGKT